MITDTHTHLYALEFKADMEEVISRAMEKNVTRFFLPNIDSTSISDMLDLSKKYPGSCYPMMGLHPCSVKENYEEELKTVEQWLHKEKFVAVGEIGLDYFWDLNFIEQQKAVFQSQIELAVKYGLPVVIHTRTAFQKTTESAFADAVSIIQKINDKKLTGIFHCFSGTVEDAMKVIELGFYIGIGGMVTIKHAALDKVLEQVDLQHIVLETDSPYVSPVPFRGKRNESSYLTYIIRKVAELKKASIEEVAAVTTENSRKIFGV